jgi:hypothetical protein
MSNGAGFHVPFFKIEKIRIGKTGNALTGDEQDELNPLRAIPWHGKP